MSGAVRQVQVRRGGDTVTGAVAEGESVLAAARRIGGHLDVWPIDVGAEPARFAVDSDLRVAVRPMTRGDLPDVVRWRQARHVRRWWSSDGPASLESVTARYGPRIDGESPTRMWVYEVNGRSIGLVQDYRLGDYPDYPVVGAGPDALGVDYLLGEVEWIGVGLGTRCLWAWAVRAQARFPEVATYFAAPDHRNAASLRLLEKAGFTAGVWFDELQDDGSSSTVVGCSLDVATVLG